MNTDDEFTALLADYAAPVADDGFAEAVLAEAALREQRAERLARWRVWLSGGALFGTALTLALMTGPLLPEVPLESVSAGLRHPALLGAVALLPLGWLALDPDMA